MSIETTTVILKAWFVASDGTRFYLDVSTLTVEDGIVRAKLQGGQSHHNFREDDVYFLEGTFVEQEGEIPCLI